MEANAFGTGGKDSDVPVLLAYDGYHYESLLPRTESDIKRTVELRDQYLTGDYASLKRNIPVPRGMTNFLRGSKPAKKSKPVKKLQSVGVSVSQAEAIDNNKPVTQVLEKTSRPTSVIMENPSRSKRSRTDNTVISRDQSLGDAKSRESLETGGVIALKPSKRLRADSTGSANALLVTLEEETYDAEEETVDLTLNVASEESLGDLSLDLSAGWEAVGDFPLNLNAFGDEGLDLTLAEEGVLDLSASRNAILDLSASRSEVLDLSSTREDALDLRVHRYDGILLREDSYNGGVFRGVVWARGLRRERGYFF